MGLEGGRGSDKTLAHLHAQMDDMPKDAQHATSKLFSESRFNCPCPEDDPNFTAPVLIIGVSHHIPTAVKPLIDTPSTAGRLCRGLTKPPRAEPKRVAIHEAGAAIRPRQHECTICSCAPASTGRREQCC